MRIEGKMRHQKIQRSALKKRLTFVSFLGEVGVLLVGCELGFSRCWFVDERIGATILGHLGYDKRLHS